MEFEIKPQGKFNLGLNELWQYQELFYFFTWRDIKVKYKQTVLGFLWAVIQPVFMTFIFTVFLGENISQKTKIDIPYPLFALSGMLVWGIYSSGMSNSANSMVNNANIIKKIYFPRLIIPISSVLVALVDFLIAFIVFLFLLLYYKTEINYSHLLFLPLSLFITCLSTIGCGTLLSALNVKYRDVRYIIPFLIQGLVFLTPVMYPVSITNNLILKTILRLNPISGALELFRGLFLSYSVDYTTILLSTITSLVLFIAGIFYFRKTESYFADLA
jgi:lipopolysaccharide transport system permease protein